ncbi:MAG TPA: PAS domain S-box protein, partial [Thermotogota bacterium]|nr:PAS domain S-box protein [Thermotogota bacterium]
MRRILLLICFVFCWLCGSVFSMTQAELEGYLALNYRNIVYVFDPQTLNILFSNERASEYYGYTLEQFTSMNLMDISLLSEDDLRDQINEALEVKQKPIINSQRLADGSIRTIEVHGWPIEVDGKTLLFTTVFDVTERERTKKELEKSLVKLTKAEEMGDVGHYEIYLSEEKMVLSKGAEMIYGLVGDLWPSSTIYELILPEDREKVAKSREELVRVGKRYDVTFSIRRANDGELRYLRSLGDYDTVNNTIFGVVHDITEQKKAAAELKARNDAFFWTLTAGILTITAIAALLALSVLKQLKVGRELLESKRKIDVQNEELQAANEELAASNEQLAATNEELIATNEELNAVNQTLERSFIEIESKNAALERIKAEFEELLQQTGAVVWQVDLNGTFVSLRNLNPEVNGFTEEEMLGKMSVYDLHPEETRGEFKAYITEVMRSEKTLWNFEHPVSTRDGRKRWVLSVWFPAYDERHRSVGYRGINIDITAKKALEEALIKSKEEAQAALKAKSAFLSNMSHEIRTPMNASMGFTHLLLETEENPEKRKMLEQIDASNRYLLNLVNKILDLSKIEDGKIRIREEDFMIGEMLDRIVDNFSHLARAKALDFFVKREPEMPVIVQGDELRLEQILNNVLSNAIKFTEKGAVTFEMAATPIENSEHRMLFKFKIADTGIGIEEKDFQRIFDKFEQAESYLTKKYGGTGLGLSITKELVDRMKGFLRLESSTGKGTTVVIEIPMTVDGEAYTKKSENGGPVTYDLEGVHILIAEDNEITQNLMKRIFQRHGISVDLAENGQKALEMLQQNRYDLLLMDIQMPILNGIDTTKLIRREE